MTSPIDQIKSLQENLKLAEERLKKNEVYEKSLYKTELLLEKDLSLLKVEKELLSQHFENLKMEISQIKNQITSANVVHTSDKLTMENQIAEVNSHKEGFNILFQKEQELTKIQQKELIQKENEEIMKNAKLLEVNEEKIIVIESECEAIEREFNILMNRKQAMIRKLRRSLRDSEATRQTIMEQKGLKIQN